MQFDRPVFIVGNTVNRQPCIVVKIVGRKLAGHIIGDAAFGVVKLSIGAVVGIAVMPLQGDGVSWLFPVEPNIRETDVGCE